MSQCVACGDEINWISVFSPHGAPLCEVGLACARQNSLQDQEFLRCRFLPMWSILHTWNSSLFAHYFCQPPPPPKPHTNKQTGSYNIFAQLSEQRGRCLDFLPAAWLGRVWWKSGLGNPSSRLLHAIMLMKLLLQ